MADFVSSLLRFVLKLALGLMASVLAVSVLVAALLVLAFSLLKALITGRKPAPARVFSRFRGYAPHAMWPGKAKPAGEVVDVEVRELREVPDDASVLPTPTPPATRRPASRGNATDVTDKTAARPADAAP